MEYTFWFTRSFSAFANSFFPLHLNEAKLFSNTNTASLFLCLSSRSRALPMAVWCLYPLFRFPPCAYSSHSSSTFYPLTDQSPFPFLFLALFAWLTVFVFLCSASDCLSIKICSNCKVCLTPSVLSGGR